MAKVTIGGKEYTIPELSFLALEKAWPHIERSMISTDPMVASSTGLHIIALGLQHAEGQPFDKNDFEVPDLGLNDDDTHQHVVHFLKRKLKASELNRIAPCINQIIEEAGLTPEPGENEAAATLQSPPTSETAPGTSSSSLQPELKADPGTP